MTRAAVGVLGVLGLVAALWLYTSRRASPEPGDAGLPPLPGEPLLESEGRIVPGRWRAARESSPATPEQQAKIEMLESIGYVGGSRPPDEITGVVAHDPDRAQPGYNFFTSGHFPGAVLMDMEGRVLHRWERPVEDIWLEEGAFRDRDYWRRAHLFENGDVLAIIEGLGIFKLDRRSRVLWAVKNQAHHDLEVQPDGDILVLTRRAHMMPRLHETEPILEDFVVRLDSEGRERQRVSLVECVENSAYRDVVGKGRIGSGDIFHTNTVFSIRDSFGIEGEWARPGNVLVCFCALHMVAAIDLREESLLEKWTGPFRLQHDPKLLPGGAMMLFDNQGGKDGASRVVEFDPVTRTVRWVYEGTGASPLFSKTLGTADPQPAGTVLIVESDNGRVLEVTREGDVVWEYRSPYRYGEYVASIFDMVRIPPGFPLEWVP
jgi:hypothetical protein